jgi:hypothetical protein
LKLRLFASLCFCSGRRISIWLFVVNFNFIFSIGQGFRAGHYKISHLQQYLPVGGNFYRQHFLRHRLPMRHISLQISLIITLISCFVACKHNKPHHGQGNDGPILSILAIFEECGEWSGHKEEIIVSQDEKWNEFAVYRIYPYNCDSLDYYYGNDKVKPNSETKVLLDHKRRKSINDYIVRLATSKANETSFVGNAGHMFSIVNRDSTLMIQVYDTKKYDVDSYRQLVNELFK